MGKSATKKLESFFCKNTKIAYKKGETILSAEDEPQGVYYLKDGYVRLYAISEDGNELTLNIYKPGSYFPVIWALGGLSNRYYFGAMTNVVIYRAQKKSLLSLFKKIHLYFLN